MFDPNQYLSHFCQSNRFNDCLDDDIESARSYSGIHLFDDGVVPGDQSIDVNIQQNCSTDLLEMWFPGDHADVSATWLYGEADSKIARLSLR